MEAKRSSFSSGTSGMSFKKRLGKMRFLAAPAPHVQPDQARYIRHDRKAFYEVGTKMTAIETF
jgi:hypothetical protein